MRDPALRSPAALAYGRLAIATLAGTTTASAAALTLTLAWLVSASRLAPGLPYGDVPLALLLIGGAASAAALAAASAYFAQVALAREAARTTRACHGATVLLMTVAYLAFAAGGFAFSRFAWAAASSLSALARAGA